MALPLQRAAFSLLALVGSAISQPTVAQQNATSVSNRLVHQFPAGVWIENLAVRSNGNLLLTTLTPNASVYEVVNPASANPSTELRFTTASVDSFFGISELSTDQFAILGGNHTPTAGTPGQWAVWTGNFAGGSTLAPAQPQQFTAKVPDAVLLNGASAVPGNPDVVLAADSSKGAVFRVNVRTKKVDVTQDLPEMKPSSGTTYSIGINGLRVRGNYLYFTNSATHTLYRIMVNPADGSTASGAKVETVQVLDASFADDFDFGPAGGSTAWVATNFDNSIIAVAPGGEARVAAGGTDSPVIPSDTSCRFGRTAADANVLYVTTAGKGTEGAKVVAIEVGAGIR
ncbi:hypothetical protein E4U54_004698 [Claviceps lovelessii]|nr:hypothetical protein E4U54_004698 [Claviceps lovelessii]